MQENTVATSRNFRSILAGAVANVSYAFKGNQEIVRCGLAAYTCGLCRLARPLPTTRKTVQETPTGTLLDLAYLDRPASVGRVLGRDLEACNGKTGSGCATNQNSLGETIFTNALFGMAPVLIFFALGRSWS